VAGNTPQTNFAPSHHTGGRVGIIGRVSTATAAEPAQIQAPNRPNLVSVGTIVWLSQELMFFAALFAMYFTVRQVTLPDAWPPDDVHLNIPFASVNTLVLVSSSLTCQLGVFAAERGDVKGLRKWFVITYLMGAFFVAGQVFEYTELVHEGLTLSSSPYGSVFYLTTGFHALHVTGGLIAFLFVLATTYIARRFDHDQATRAIVVSYYWHFVDVVWIALFATIYFIQ
jgi:cytochrome c oxidase subunit III